MRKPNILIVDDVEINREILETILEGLYHVYHATNGMQALEMLESGERNYRLMLLDLDMPVMDGYTLLEKLNQSNRIKELPVIIASCNNKQDYIIRAYELGAVDYFTKPYNAQIISRRVKDLISLYERDYRDTVTEAYSRKGFIREVEDILENTDDPTKYALLCFNIKGFKAINELYGIAGGDKLLRNIYSELENSGLRPSVTARLEADHFVCLAKKEYLDFDQLARHMEKEWKVNGSTMFVYIQCGIYFVEDRSISVSGMIDRARLARQTLGEKSTNSYAVFDSSLAEDYVDQVQVLTDFEEAIKNDEFQVYYQPVVDVKTGKLVSAEALVRWIHPIRGFVSPGTFISVLEKNGLISKLDWYVMQKVREFIGKRYEAGLPVVPVSVNLSWIDFYDFGMSDQLLNQIKNSPFPNNYIRCEVTETTFVSQENSYANYLEKFREQGVKVYLDDFGTGYSSFGMLKSYSFDILKIDMSFVRQITTSPKVCNIIRAIIDMCHQIGIHVIAEGVETEEQKNFLLLNGCEFIQGYYYSKPLPEEEFVAYIDEHHKDNRILGINAYERNTLRSYFKEEVSYFNTEMRAKFPLEHVEIMSLLLNSNAVGVISGLFDEGLSMAYISDVARNGLGYTMEELLEDKKGSFLMLLPEEERTWYMDTIEEPSRIYHMVMKNGTSIKVKEVRRRETNSSGEYWIIAINKIEE